MTHHCLETKALAIKSVCLLRKPIPISCIRFNMPSSVVASDKEAWIDYPIERETPITRTVASEIPHDIHLAHDAVKSTIHKCRIIYKDFSTRRGEFQ